MAIPAGSMAGNGPEGCMVDRKGKQKAGNESEGYNWARKCRSGVWEAGAQLECRICEKGTFSMYCGKSPYSSDQEVPSVVRPLTSLTPYNVSVNDW